MRNTIANGYLLLGNPIVAAALAIVIVVSLGAWAASKVHFGNEGEVQQAERVTVAKDMMVGPPATPAPQPELKIATGSASVPAAQVPQPLIARTGRISLFVTGVDAAVRRLSNIARRNAGDVFSLDVSNDDRSANAGAQMEIRVPAAAFERTMDEAAQAGKVRERSVSAEDLTGDITDSSARLLNLRQTESDIRKIMDRSGNVSQVMDAENQLSQVREQIETLEASIASMRGRVAYSTISVDMQAEVPSQTVEPTAASQLAAAWQSAVHALAQLGIGSAAVLLWIVVFTPLALAAGAVAFGFATVLKRRHA